jgi:hypothetical protein
MNEHDEIESFKKMYSASVPGSQSSNLIDELAFMPISRLVLGRSYDNPDMILSLFKGLCTCKRSERRGPLH